MSEGGKERIVVLNCSFFICQRSLDSYQHVHAYTQPLLGLQSCTVLGISTQVLVACATNDHENQSISSVFSTSTAN